MKPLYVGTIEVPTGRTTKARCWTVFASASALLAILAGCFGVPDDFPKAEMEAGTRFVRALSQGNAAVAHDMLAQPVKQQMTQEELQAIWDEVIADKGNFQAIASTFLEPTIDPEGIEITSVLVECLFATGLSPLMLEVNQAGEIQSFDTENVPAHYRDLPSV